MALKWFRFNIATCTHRLACRPPHGRTAGFLLLPPDEGSVRTTWTSAERERTRGALSAGAASFLTKRNEEHTAARAPSSKYCSAALRHSSRLAIEAASPNSLICFGSELAYFQANTELFESVQSDAEFFYTNFENDSIWRRSRAIAIICLYSAQGIGLARHACLAEPSSRLDELSRRRLSRRRAPRPRVASRARGHTRGTSRQPTSRPRL